MAYHGNYYPNQSAASSYSQPVYPQQAGNVNLPAIFQMVDRDRNGKITAEELQEALLNGTSQPFNPSTIKIMMNLFGQDYSGAIDYNEFATLFLYVDNWKSTFSAYDRDRSGFIDKNELKTALASFGYQLSDHLHDVLLRKFDRQGRGVIFFDDFIHCCVSVEKVTRAFRSRDAQGIGVINVSFEDFLVLALEAKV